MFRFAVVGTGNISSNHIAAIRALPDAELAAIVGRNEDVGKRIAAEAGCPYFPTLQEALSEADIDVVDIVLPTFLHEECAIEAARAGCHVLCEKPVAFSLESLDRIFAACEENGVRFMSAQVGRFWPEYAAIKKFLEDGRLGTVRMVYEKRLARHPDWATWHRDPAKSGGGLYDLNIHDVDFLVWCFGMPEKLYATGWKSPTGCWNHVAANMTWKSGVQALCETSLEMAGKWPFSLEFRAVGDRGTLTYQMPADVRETGANRSGALLWYPEGGEPVEIGVPKTDMFADEIEEFLASIRESRPASVENGEVRDALRVVIGTERSLEEKCVVDF